MDEFILLQCNIFIEVLSDLFELKTVNRKLQHAFHILLFTIFPVKKLYKL